MAKADVTSAAEPGTAVQRSAARALLRVAAWSTIGFVGLFSALLLAVRFILVPGVERHPADVASMLSRELGAPVVIDAIGTSWDGWNPKMTVRGLRVLAVDRADAQPLVEISQATSVLAWTSLFTADLRLTELTIDGARVLIRRDRDGRVHVAGFAIDPRDARQNRRVVDWLLKQRLALVRDATLTWSDELRGAPELELKRVQLRLENRFGTHRFGLKGAPPPSIAAPLDLRGEFSASSVTQRKPTGRLFARLDYADIAAWSNWIAMPVDVQSGQGALRTWFDIDEGVVRRTVADLELADVRTTLASDLETLDLSRLAGRVTWKREEARHALSGRGLTLAEVAGAAIGPIDVEVRFDVAPNGAILSGRASSTRLDLRPLSGLASQLPLPSRVRNDLALHSPQGTVVDAEYAWTGPLVAPTTFRTHGRFTDLGVNAHDALPGFKGLSGRFDASDRGGTLEVTSRNGVLAMPKVFTEPIALDVAGARVRWDRRGDIVNVRIDEATFANVHVAGAAQGTWRSTAVGPGTIDLTARLSRAQVKDVHRYLPTAVHPDIRTWLKFALLAGTSSDARLTLKGDLARFPFADGKDGTFLVTARIAEAAVDYADAWPKVTHVDADLRIEGHLLSIAAARGRMLGAAIGPTTAMIADLSQEYPELEVDGEASGPTTEFLRFVSTTPVAAWIDRATEQIVATGDGKLALKFSLPLGKEDPVANVAGSYEFREHRLEVPGAPTLTQLNGRLEFSERGLIVPSATFQAWGGRATASLKSGDGTLRVKAEGTATADAVRAELKTPYLDALRGSTDWKLDLESGRNAATWTMTSTLRGVAIDLPDPLRKSADEAIVLSLRRTPLSRDASRELIEIDYGQVARVVAQRRVAGAASQVERAVVLLGESVKRGDLPANGNLALRGDIAALDLDAWLAVAKSHESASASTEPSEPTLASIDIRAGELTVFGRRFDAMTLFAQRAAKDWRLRFDSRQVEGLATWEGASPARANGRLSAQLGRLDFTALRASTRETERNRPEARQSAPSTWPELDIHAGRFIARAGDLGRMELAARADGVDWRVTRFSIVNDAGRIDADGTWRPGPRESRTEFDVTVMLDNPPRFLARLGLPDDIIGAAGLIHGRLGWAGSPVDFEHEKLAGQFDVRFGAGQFTKMNPGMGKLLGVLSLQALPRRVALDFRDVFSEGFAFDTVSGSMRIANGILHSDDLVVSGPAAKVTLAGDVDLEAETQRLQVRVQPSLSTVVSTGAGAAAIVLLAANPLVGAAVGAGTLLAQKIMRDPIEQMFSYEYAVSGSWSDPIVERGTRFAQRATGDSRPPAVER
ncbi:MAG TPA: YhdP family protein [Casimicrobiaceae bacterium]|nr:YhdP family protein [Casimicrobiaceae bacterium]